MPKGFAKEEAEWKRIALKKSNIPIKRKKANFAIGYMYMYQLNLLMGRPPLCSQHSTGYITQLYLLL